MNRVSYLMSQGFQDSTADDWERLGMEARSIIRSVKTEHAKLNQSGQWARSDLHYFRARLQYYRLSLTRLEEFERRYIEPTLNAFRQQITYLEGQSASAAPESAPPPFLAPVENFKESAPAKQEPTLTVDSGSAENLDAQTWKSQLLGELEIVQVALCAEASNDRNRIIGDAVRRAIDLIR